VLFLWLSQGACSSGKECQEVCARTVACLEAHLASQGLETAPVVESAEQLRQACATGCGGRWEQPSPSGEALLEEPCDSWAASRDGVGEPGSAGFERLFLAAATSRHDGVRIVPDPTCRALAGEEALCATIEEEREREDCLLVTTMRRALASGRADECRGLPPPQLGFCAAAVGGEASACESLTPPFDGLCRQYLAGSRGSDHARLMLAVRMDDEAICLDIEEARLRASCLAALRGSQEPCPRSASLAPSLLFELGEELKREDAAPPDSAAPAFLPAIYHVLSILAWFFWPLLGLWLVRRLLSLARESPASIPWLLALIGGAACLRLLATTGPLNFVEYERIFVPSADDLGRLGYSGQSLLLAPLFMLFGPSAKTVFAVNGLFFLLCVPATLCVARSLGAGERAALAAAALVALNPVLCRVSASASETVGFALLALIFFDLRLDRRPGAWSAASLPLIAPLLAVYRPEGVFILFPFLLLGFQLRWHGAVQLASLLIVGLELAGFLALFLTLSPPPVVAGLFFVQAREFLVEMLDPRLFSPLLLLAGLALPVLCLLARAGGQAVQSARWKWPGTKWPLAAGSTSVAAWSAVLLFLWCLQGTEGNVAFGSARYLAMLVPWLAAASALLFPLLRRERLAAALLVGSLAFQGPLLLAETNLQKEFRFLNEAAALLPSDSLVVIPTARGSASLSLAPENGPLAVLSLADKEASWMGSTELSDRLAARAEGASGPPLPPKLYVLRTFYPEGDLLGRLASSCSLVPVLEHPVRSRPDVAWYRDIPEGETVELGLWLVNCSE
jgi:hypothetical protein